MKKKIVLGIALAALVPFLGGCPDKIDGLVEEAKFFLDQCNPADATTHTNCTSASEKADELIAQDAASVDGAIFSSSAHLGLAGIDFLQVTSEMADLGNTDSNNNSGQTTDSGDDDFAEFRSIVTNIETENGQAISLTELESAKSALTTLLASAPEATDDNKRAYFQLGMVLVIDGFIRPVKLAGSVTSITSAASLTGITATEAARANTDFFNADNNLATGGTTDADFLDPIRQNFCRCKANVGAMADDTATNVMTVTCLQDLMLCELKTSLTGVTLNNDYDGSGTADGVDCATLLRPTGATWTSCIAGNTN